MCSKAGISMEGRNITNHSGKVTCATSLFEKGFDKQLIMNRTHQRSLAVRSDLQQLLKKEVSEALQPPAPPKKFRFCNQMSVFQHKMIAKNISHYSVNCVKITVDL